MITYRDILATLNIVKKWGLRGRGGLDDPAMVLVDGEFMPVDLLEMEIEEIGDKRLVFVPVDDTIELTQEDKDENDETR